MLTKLVALAIATAASVNAVYIDTPVLNQCGAFTLTFGSGATPYYVAVLPALNPCESDSIAEFHDVYGGTADYQVNLPAGTQVQLYVLDADDQEAWSGIVTIGGSADYSCVGGSPPPAADPPSSPNPPAGDNNQPPAPPPAANPPPTENHEETGEDLDEIPPIEEETLDVEPEDNITDVDEEIDEDSADAEGSTYVAPPFQPNSVSNSNSGSSGNSGAGSPNDTGDETPENAAESDSGSSFLFVNTGSLLVSLLAVAFALQA